MESSGGEAASLREAPLPQTPSPEEQLAFKLGRFCLLGSACEMDASPIGWVAVTAADRAAATMRRGGTNPSARFAGTSPFRGGFFCIHSILGRLPRAKHVLPPPHLPSPKHRPIVENGTFSTGPFVRNRRDTRLGRPCEAPPTQAFCHEGGPGAGAPHGILAGPRQPLVPFPCGKGTRASADARNSLKPHPHPRPCTPNPLPPFSPKTHKKASDFSEASHVPVAGLEPARHRWRWILSPLRLPIPSHRRTI